MDLFYKIKKLEVVKKVSNFYLKDGEKINFIFFICPKNKIGFKLDSTGLGVAINYGRGLCRAAKEKINKVNEFIFKLNELNIGIDFDVTAIFASADSLLLTSLPAKKPENPKMEGFKLVENYLPVQKNLETFGSLYRERPWEKVPERFVTMEDNRLRNLMSSSIPQNVADDFITRVFAGFALDGKLIKDGEFGDNPVILGVESPGVAILQNSIFEKKEDRIAVIQL